MPERCACCGAALPQGSTCHTIHEELATYELLNAIPHSIHFLHVTCFMIQHEGYSDEGLVWAQSMLRANLDDLLTEGQHYAHLRAAIKNTSSSRRAWTFKRTVDAPALPKPAWSVTVVDVAQEMDDATRYCERVKQWARVTLHEMAALQL